MKQNKIICIIICAGDATRWGNYLNVPKHLISINGETLLERTVTQLQQYNTKIYVVGKNKDSRYKIKGSKYYEAKLDKANVNADKFLSSKELWNKDGRTVVLYGDVWFSTQAIKTIIEYTDRDWHLFCNKKECFAQSFYPEGIEEHENALYTIRDAFKNKEIDRCGGWEHYRVMTNTPLKEHKLTTRYTLIEDLTDDFDFPCEYDEWITRYNNENSICV